MARPPSLLLIPPPGIKMAPQTDEPTKHERMLGVALNRPNTTKHLSADGRKDRDSLLTVDSEQGYARESTWTAATTNTTGTGGDADLEGEGETESDDEERYRPEEEDVGVGIHPGRKRSNPKPLNKLAINVEEAPDLPVRAKPNGNGIGLGPDGPSSTGRIRTRSMNSNASTAKTDHSRDRREKEFFRKEKLSQMPMPRNSGGSKQSSLSKAQGISSLAGGAQASSPTQASRRSNSSQVIQPASPTVPKPPPSTASTLAVLYLVCGLPKDPSCWTLSDHTTDLLPSNPTSLSMPTAQAAPAHLEGAVSRWWRPEVLGTTVSQSGVEPSEPKRRRGIGKKDRGEMGGGGHHHGIIPKEETARIQAKAMKLAFTREVEVIASTIQPPSTVHNFSFTIANPSASGPASVPGAIGQAWDNALARPGTGTTPPTTSTSHGPPTTTYYCSCLVVWSHADTARSEAIRQAVENGGKIKTVAIARAVKAAAAGKRFGEKLESRMESPMGIVPDSGKSFGGKNKGWSSGAETDTETEAYMTESEWGELSDRGGVPLAILPQSTPFWLPYALVLVSRHPLYDLMTDVLRISWARFHSDIARHSLEMSKFLNFPTPKPGETLRLPVGLLDFRSTFVNVDFQMWPLFKALSAENILTICEIALSPLGKVIFFCRHPIMLNIAVETFRYLLEMRGWSGIVHSAVHSRDLPIYLSDPGPFLLGLNVQTRSIVGTVATDILQVDLDTDSVSIDNPYPGALSKGATREKLRKKLEVAIGHPGHYYGVPPELHEAFPANRFRPFSAVEVEGRPTPAERLMPQATWDWNQQRVIAAFDRILAQKPRTGFLKHVLRSNVPRRAATLDPGTQHVQTIVRQHASSFVDRRDMLEAKIWKLNRRLAFLMAESAEWKNSMKTFQRFADKLTKESAELKTRLEKERREAKRLSGVVSEQELRQKDLSMQLQNTEKAREAAFEELKKMQQIRLEITQQRDTLASEIRHIVNMGDSSPAIMENIFNRLDHTSEIGSRPPTAQSNRSQSRDRQYYRRSHNRSISPAVDNGSELDFDETMEQISEEPEGDDDESIFFAEKIAVEETMRSIQNRLEMALRQAGQWDGRSLVTSPPDSPTSSSTVHPEMTKEANGDHLRTEGGASPNPGKASLSQKMLSKMKDIRSRKTTVTAHSPSVTSSPVIDPHPISPPATPDPSGTTRRRDSKQFGVAPYLRPESSQSMRQDTTRMNSSRPSLSSSPHPPSAFHNPTRPSHFKNMSNASVLTTDDDAASFVSAADLTPDEASLDNHDNDLSERPSIDSSHSVYIDTADGTPQRQDVRTSYASTASMDTIVGHSSNGSMSGFKPRPFLLFNSSDSGLVEESTPKDKRRSSLLVSSNRPKREQPPRSPSIPGSFA
ncbi:hypothetical protein BT69DRAFT_1330378 [Atractiella rhizophila]|nr:hypothetical protein BT69DRAFT_1330378 [Atractiella rhizophila]